MKSIILIDDEKEILADRSKIIEDLGYKCYTANNGKTGVKLIKDKNPDAVLTDLKMPEEDGDGFHVLKNAQKIDPDLPVIIFTGHGTIGSAVEAMRIGAYEYLQKPVSVEMMEIALKKAIEYRSLKRENISLKNQISQAFQLFDFIGATKITRDIAKRVSKVAQSDANCLIYGESGTGKELIARNIHMLSHRKDGPFIAVDCVSIPENLIESELFGYDRGAFTGAYKRKEGLFETADNGTLFLDEIVELDLNMQAKLLRVLQERQFRPIGSTNLKKINFRIISATNKNPEIAVSEKLLREDLNYRLNVIPIYLPPLRERKEDIPLLITHFMDKFRKSCPNKIDGIDKKAVNALTNFHWPGNVRQLQNVIEKVMVLTDSNIISYSDLPEKIRLKNVSITEKAYENLDYKSAKELILNDFNKNYFSNLLAKYNGNISRVARETGVSRWTIYRILNNGIDHDAAV